MVPPPVVPAGVRGTVAACGRLSVPDKVTGLLHSGKTGGDDDCCMPSPQISSPSMASRHWIIGDVHGCASALEQLVGLLPSTDRLVLLGDVINRGPSIEEAMELAWALVTSGRGVWLMGNHEKKLLDALGSQSVNSFSLLAGCDTYRQLGHRSCQRWIHRLQNLPTAFWGEGWVATHAGFDPVRWMPDLGIRLPFWQAYDGRYGEVIVGHTPAEHVRRLNRILLLDTGACYGGRLTAYCPESGDLLSVAGPAVRSLASPSSPLDRRFAPTV
ncbi:MAG: metallophosphoesterase [Cyanobacteriota bacterium]|nr:metallophosphoesterase [Cyanobacteriota bacterium]